MLGRLPQPQLPKKPTIVSSTARPWYGYVRRLLPHRRSWPRYWIGWRRRQKRCTQVATGTFAYSGHASSTPTALGLTLRPVTAHGSKGQTEQATCNLRRTTRQDSSSIGCISSGWLIRHLASQLRCVQYLLPSRSLRACPHCLWAPQPLDHRMTLVIGGRLTSLHSKTNNALTMRPSQQQLNTKRTRGGTRTYGGPRPNPRRRLPPHNSNGGS